MPPGGSPPSPISTSRNVGARFMIFAAIIELVLGVRAEGKSLENIATPLTAFEEATGTSAASRAT